MVEIQDRAMEAYKRKLRSCRGEAANGHRTYDVQYLGPQFVTKAGEILQDRFGFGPLVERVVGLDAVITECKKGDLILHLGWDNWTGFYVMADSLAGDLVVDQFGDYVDSILANPAILLSEEEEADNKKHCRLLEVAAQRLSASQRLNWSAYSSGNEIARFALECKAAIERGAMTMAQKRELRRIFAPTSDWDDMVGDVDLGNCVFSLIEKL